MTIFIRFKDNDITVTTKLSYFCFINFKVHSKINKMKHLFLILFGALLLCSCQDRGIESELTPSPCQKQEDNNNAFLVFSSREELAEAISNLRSGKHYDATRASNMSTVTQTKKTTVEVGPCNFFLCLTQTS